MNGVEIASISGPIVAVAGAAIAYRQLRVARQGATLPILTASIESRGTPERPMAHVVLNNSASIAPALNVHVEARFTPRAPDARADQIEVTSAPVLLPGAQLELTLPPSLSRSGFTVEEFLLSYSSVTVRVAYRARGLWRTRRMRQSLSTLAAIGMARTVADPMYGAGDV